jgi:hypothetical protein
MPKSTQKLNFFDYLSKRIPADSKYGKILIEIDEQNRSIEQAIDIINNLEIELKKIEYVKNPNGGKMVALITLDTEDIQGIILKLVENGFSKIIGFKPMGTC